MTDKTMTLDEFTKEIELRHAVVRALERMDHDDPQGVRLIREHLLHLDNQIDSITRHISQPAERGEAVEFEYPEFHVQGMGCGLEDRGITDRYEAMRYGFDEALDQMARILEDLGPLYTAPPPAAGVPEFSEPDLSNWARHYSINPVALEALRSMLSAAPLPTIDIATFHGLEIIENANVPDGEIWVYDKRKLARAIGDAK